MSSRQPRDQAPETVAETEIVNRVVAIDSLAAHPRNYRRHPDTQIKRIAASVARFGQVRSIVVQEGAPGQYLIVAGHGLVEGAKREGKKRLRADIIPATWSPEQVEGYLVADNLLGQLADDDEVGLAEILQEQQNAGFDLESLGGSDDDLRELLDKLTNEADRGGQGGDDEGEGGESGEASDGSLLALVDVTIADPSHTVETGQIWDVGPHVLLIADPTTDHKLYTPFLGRDDAACYYPGPFVPLSVKAENYNRLVMVQPDTYIAGHLLDRYAEVNGEDSVRLRDADE